MPVYCANYKAAAVRHPRAGGHILVLMLLVDLCTAP